MPLLVRFQNEAAFLPESIQLELGPFRVCTVGRDAVWVFDGLTPLQLAVWDGGGWRLCDRDDGSTYTGINIVPTNWREEVADLANDDYLT